MTMLQHDSTGQNCPHNNISISTMDISDTVTPGPGLTRTKPQLIEKSIEIIAATVMIRSPEQT